MNDRLFKGVKFSKAYGGFGSYVVSCGQISHSFSVAKFGDDQARIMALEKRLEYLDAREKFKLDFKAYDALLLARKELRQVEPKTKETLAALEGIERVIVEAKR